MNLPDVVSREEWLAARKELLAREKEMTRQKDQLNADRRRLPMVAVTKDYRFEGPDGEATMTTLFDGCTQLIVQHFMFDPSWDAGCPSCSAAVAELSTGLIDHLRTRDTAFAVVSRAPFAKLEAYRAEKGWPVRWYSSHGSDFNYDFHVTLDASVAPIQFNYRDLPELEESGFGWIAQGPNEQPGYSTFLQSGGATFHTYSTFGRGTEQLGGAYAFLDMTALGRQEEWEEPNGRSDATRGAVPNFES